MPLPSDRKYMITDPLRPHEGFETERVGDVTPGPTNYIRTDKDDLAKEIKQRRPWALVTPFEDNHGGRATRTQMVVPELPWKKENTDGCDDRIREADSDEDGSGPGGVKERVD